MKVKRIKKLNKLSSSIVHPGQVLKLVESRKLASKKAKIASGSGTVHTIKRGETLIGIAKKYNVSLPLLMEKNSLNFKSILVAGRQIIIPR